MHLHGLPNGQPARSFELNSKEKAGQRSGEGESRVENKPATRTDPGHSIISSKVLRLAEELNRIPETRDRIIARAAERLESGYYLTQEAADQVADKLSGN